MLALSFDLANVDYQAEYYLVPLRTNQQVSSEHPYLIIQMKGLFYVRVGFLGIDTFFTPNILGAARDRSLLRDWETQPQYIRMR
jgi:hypothetical protein